LSIPKNPSQCCPTWRFGQNIPSLVRCIHS
jgi:hypothetical protein